MANGSEPQDLSLRDRQSSPLDTGSAHFVSKCDPIELTLANALRSAVDAKQWEIVAQLAAELTARRAAKSTANVVPLGRRTERSQR